MRAGRDGKNIFFCLTTGHQTQRDKYPRTAFSMGAIRRIYFSGDGSPGTKKIQPGGGEYKSAAMREYVERYVERQVYESGECYQRNFSTHLSSTEHLDDTRAECSNRVPTMERNKKGA